MGYRIITHDGKAHMDELTASAFLVLAQGEFPSEILRIDSRDAERMVREGDCGEDDWFLDCGMVFDPKRKMFDHHQDGELSSTVLMVFEHFFPELKDSRLHDDVALLSRVDTRGLRSLNDYETLDESMSYWSFSQKLLLKGFESKPVESLSLVCDALRDRIDFEEKRHEALIWLQGEGRIEVVELGGERVLNYLVPPPEGMASALRSADKEMVDELEIAAVCSMDVEDSAERSLFRTIYGQERLDFTLSSPNEILFCHPGGFLLKFRDEEGDEWKTLFLDSLKPGRS